MDLFGCQRCAIEKTFTQMRQISVWMAGGGNSLVHLHDMNCRPRHVRTRESAQHHPRCMAAADGYDETAARGDGFPRLLRDDIRGSLGHRFSRFQYLKVDGLSHA